MQKENKMEETEMSVLKLLALTVLPSAIATAIYIVAGFFLQGIPAIDLFLMIAMLTVMPFEIMVVLSANKKEYGTYGVRIAFSNHKQMDWWKIFLYGLVLFSFAGIMTVTVQPLENWLMRGLSDKVFAALPTYFDWNDFELMKSFPKGTLIFTSAIYLALNGFIYPIIEEIYFRGYLTNRLNRYGMLTPIIVVIVFSFYHWWLPFNNIFRICAFGAAALIAYKKKNIFISIIFHCLCNVFSSISFIIALLN